MLLDLHCKLAESRSFPVNVVPGKRQHVDIGRGCAYILLTTQMKGCPGANHSLNSNLSMSLSTGRTKIVQCGSLELFTVAEW